MSANHGFMKTYSSNANDSLRIEFFGKLDYLKVTGVREELRQLVVEPRQQVVVNLQNVTFLDGSGLGAISYLLHKAKKLGAQIKLEGAHGQPQKLLTGLRLEQVLC
jgi:anti-anti-sigma factor